MALNIITEPRIYVVGQQILNQDEVDRFLADEDMEWKHYDADGVEVADGLKIAELGGRVCYMSFGKAQSKRTNADYLGNIIEQQHGSVAEHAVWTFIFTGVSRSLTHEFIRHRAGISPSQLSQRYVKIGEGDFEVVIPPAYIGKPDLIELWMQTMAQVEQAYLKLSDLHEKTLDEEYPSLFKRDKRIAVAQAARSVLPNAAETKIQITANARAIRHVLEMRGSEHAEPEIRRLAVAWARVMKQIAPALFADVHIYTGDAFSGDRVYVDHHKA